MNRLVVIFLLLASPAWAQTMTAEQRAVMEHVVVDADAWLAHAVAAFGAERAQEMLAAKVARWKPDADGARKRPGYKARAARDAADKVVHDRLLGITK